MPPTTHLGQPGWRVSNKDVSFWITESGGMIGPAKFHLGPKKTVEPFAVAPWAEEPGVDAIEPPIIRTLRGDFFCAPFGANETQWRGERHPVHGDPANEKWKDQGIDRRAGRTTFRAALETKARPGRIEKNISLRAGHPAIYCEHIVHGFSGPMTLGTHPCIQFPDVEGAGRISVGGWTEGRVFPTAFEDPAKGGYQALKIDARFRDLAKVPAATGGTTDVSTFPARRGFDDLVMLLGENPKKSSLGWSAVCFPKDGYAFVQLVDRRVLRHTVLWFSNGGRHYAPWSGRHVNVVGLEAITGYFHLGLAASTKPNPLNRRGIPTVVKLDAKRPQRIAHIFAAVRIPRRFDLVAGVEQTDDGLTLTAASGASVPTPIDAGFALNADGSL